MCDYSREVITESHTGVANNANQVIRITVPDGKYPIAAGYHVTNPSTSEGLQVIAFDGSYPDGQDWVFEVHQSEKFGGWNVDFFVICGNLI